MSATATSIAIADAVVTYLNGLQTPPETNPFAPFTFTAYRDYAPSLQLTDPDIGKLKVIVCPRDKKQGVGGRGLGTRPQDDGVDILILIKPSNYDPTADRSAQLAVLDPLMLLVEQITDAVAFEDFAGSGWVATENNPIYAADGPMSLRQCKQFTSVLHLTLRRLR